MSTASAAHGVGYRDVPEKLLREFAARFAVVQQETALLWELAAGMHAAVGAELCEWVGDDLALVMNVHPQTGAGFTDKAVRLVRLPGLMSAWQGRELTDRHVSAVLDEVSRWAPDEQDQQAAIVELMLVRTRAWVASVPGRSWPTPGQLRKRVQAAAVLLDVTAPATAKRSAADRRGTELYASAVGEGTLSLRGPEAQSVRMHEAIRARAEALGELPGDERTVAQRMYDAACELICLDADHTEPGGLSRVPTVDGEGVPTPIRPRGVAVQVITPVSVLQGGDHELGEIPGYGPILPSTVRDLAAHAEHLQRLAVDAETGALLEVSDPVPVPLPEPSQAARADPLVWATDLLTATSTTLERVLAMRLQLHQQRQEGGYRPSRRLRRHVQARDRTCTFPGCPRPAVRCDLDHREEWPHGATCEANLHGLCRHHHRGKHCYFTVTFDAETGDTLWHTPDGRTHRRPPPEY